MRERKAQQALIGKFYLRSLSLQVTNGISGKYRNRFTDAVEFKVRSTANTNIVYFNGQLLALKEDSPPYALDPVTLETKGLYDFDGQLPSLTFTAHPKFDPKTGDMVCFGYEARGDGTPDVCYYNVAPDGRFTEVVWLVAPVVAMIHDFAVTENWVSLYPRPGRVVNDSMGQALTATGYLPTHPPSMRPRETETRWRALAMEPQDTAVSRSPPATWSQIHRREGRCPNCQYIVQPGLTSYTNSGSTTKTPSPDISQMPTKTHTATS